MTASRTTRVSQVTNLGKTVTRSNQKTTHYRQKVFSRRQKVERDAEDTGYNVHLIDAKFFTS